LLRLTLEFLQALCLGSTPGLNLSSAAFGFLPCSLTTLKYLAFRTLRGRDKDDSSKHIVERFLETSALSV
jgi:hypothetical protein